MRNVVLLAQSLIWPNSARLAIAFRRAGFIVEAIAPEGHPIHKMRSPSRTFVYRPFNPGESIRRAIEVSHPQLIVPCDDRVTAHLHDLHADMAKADDRSPNSISELIESSLGPPKSYEFLRQRKSLSGLSGLPNVHIPRTDTIRSLRDLEDWADAYGLPALLKLDGSTGGRDVVLVRDRADIARAFYNMSLRRSVLRQVWSMLRKWDVEPTIGFVRGGPRGVVAQSFVAGRSANCAVACWRGEVLTSFAVEVLQARQHFGVATVVHPVAGQEMRAAAQSVVRHLYLSGLCGFDFVIDDASGQAKLIEINPRATQTSHMRWDSELDAAQALRRALGGEPCAPYPATAPDPAEVVLFPHRPPSDPSGAGCAGVGYDMPFEEPELMKFFGAELPLSH